MPLIDPGLILAFFLSRLKKSNPTQLERFHKPHTHSPFVRAVRGALELFPLLKNQFILELGSNQGSGSRGLRNCIRTDIKPYMGLDVICDATSLPFRDFVFDRTWAVYLAHHVNDLKNLISEARRVSRKFYMFDFLPNSWLHYYSIIWDWLIFGTRIKALNPRLLHTLVPNYNTYKRSHLGSVLYIL